MRFVPKIVSLSLSLSFSELSSSASCPENPIRILPSRCENSECAAEDKFAMESMIYGRTNE